MRVTAGSVKNRKAATLLLRPVTAALLDEHFGNKMPAAALDMPLANRLAAVMRDDLDHACSAWLAEAVDDTAR